MRATLQGLLALFLGGIVGGLLGTALVRPATAPAATAEPGPAAPGPRSAPSQGTGPGSAEALARAIEDLRQEVERLRQALDEARSGSARAVAGEPAGVEQERLIAAVEALTRSLAAGGRPGGGGGGPSGPLLVPQGPPRYDRLRELRAIEDDEERVRGLRFLTYQEVLDRFGEPTHVYKGGRWMYADPDTGEELEFHFEDGLLIFVY